MLSKWNSLFEFYATRYKADEFLNNANGTLFSESFFNQLFVRPEIRSTYRIKKNELTVGIGTTHESLERTYFTTKPVFNSRICICAIRHKSNRQMEYHPWSAI